MVSARDDIDCTGGDADGVAHADEDPAENADAAVNQVRMMRRGGIEGVTYRMRS